MRKPKASYADMIDLPDDPGEAPAKPVQTDERMAVQSYDHTNTRKDESDKPVQKTETVIVSAPLKVQKDERVFVSAPITEPVQDKRVYVSAPRPPEEERPASTPARPKVAKQATRQARPAGVPSRREAARLRREAPKPEPADYDQRSLYARAETFERFRLLAFERRTTMQALYREGLLLVLEKYGAAEGMKPDEV